MTSMRNEDEYPQQASFFPETKASLNRPESPEAYILANPNQAEIDKLNNRLDEITSAEGASNSQDIEMLQARLREIDRELGPNPDVESSAQKPPRQLNRVEQGLTSNDGTPLVLQDLKRGSTLNRFLRGASRPLNAITQSLLNSPLADNKIIENLGITSDSLDASIAGWDASSKRGQRMLAARAGGEGNVVDFIDTTLKGSGDWDVAGGFGQVLAEAPIAIAAGRNPAQQIIGSGITGLLTPTDQAAADNFWAQKGAQAAFASLVGAVGEGVHAGGSLGWNRLKLAFKGNPQLAADSLRTHVGEDSVDDVIRLLEEDAAASAGARPLSINASAGEVAADANNPTFAAMSDLVDDQFPEQAFDRRVAQNADRNAPLNRLIVEGAEGKAKRLEETTMLRGQALDAADDLGAEAASLQAKLADAVDRNKRAIARPFSSDASRQETIMSAWDIDRFTTKLSEFVDASITPATTEKMFGGIKARLEDAEIVGNPVVKKMLSKVQGELQDMVDPKTGVIPSGALAAYRLTGLDTSIKTAMEKAGPLPRSMGDDLIRVKSLLDDTIEGSLGKTGGWKNYLDTYKEMSIPVNKGDVASVLVKSNTDVRVNPSVDTGVSEKFIDALKTPERTLKEANVLAKDFNEVFGDDFPIVENLIVDLERSGLQRSLAALGKRAPEDVTTEKKIQLANPLIREIMLINAMFSVMSKQRQAAMTQELGRLFTRDPQLGYTALAKALKDGVPRGSTNAGRAYAKLGDIFFTSLPKTASQIGAASAATSLMPDEEE